MMVLDVVKLSLSIGGTRILRDVNIAVAPGQFVGIVGPNGSGKSSLLNCLLGRYRDFSGQIRYKGVRFRDMSRKARAKAIAFVLQHNAHEFDTTVFEAVLIGRYPHLSYGIVKARDKALVTAILKDNDLYAMRHKNLGALSGGEQQRVMVARALAQQPDMLVMDEPTNHLDIRFQIDILRKVRALNIPVLCTLHDLNLAALFCDQIYLIKNGTLESYGSPSRVFTEQTIAETYAVNCIVDKHPALGCSRITYF